MGAYLILSGVFDIKVVLNVDRIIAGRVDDISNTFSPYEGSEMRTGVGLQKDALALSIVSRDIPFDGLKTGGWESGARNVFFFAFGLVFILNHCVKVIKLEFYGKRCLVVASDWFVDAIVSLKANTGWFI